MGYRSFDGAVTFTLHIQGGLKRMNCYIARRVSVQATLNHINPRPISCPEPSTPTNAQLQHAAATTKSTAILAAFMLATKALEVNEETVNEH